MTSTRLMTTFLNNLSIWTGNEDYSSYIAAWGKLKCGVWVTDLCDQNHSYISSRSNLHKKNSMYPTSRKLNGNREVPTTFTAQCTQTWTFWSPTVKPRVSQTSYHFIIYMQYMYSYYSYMYFLHTLIHTGRIWQTAVFPSSLGHGYIAV